MNVYTYYNHVPQLSAEQECKLILAWKENWKSAGFTPIVLNEYSVKSHPKFDALNEAISRLPSVNPGNYDSACYMRWLVMSSLPNGGIMADYDCFNYGWQPPKSMPARLNMYQGHVPCLVIGDAKAYERMVDAIINYKLEMDDEENGRPHVSDMKIAMKRGRQIDIVMHNKVKMYKEEGWQTASAVHYSTSSMTGDKNLPRYKFVQTLRPWKTS